MNFCSDNVTAASPEILQALMEANRGSVMPYGADPYTQRLTEQLREIFEKPDIAVFPVATGSAANALILGAMVPPFGAVYCHPEAHINVDECGAPELYTGGAKLIGIPGVDGKLRAIDLADVLARAGVGVVHNVQPAALSLTQATEAGTVYQPEEIAALAEVAHAQGLKVHMDGARFANALVRLGCSPAEMTWKVGIDALALGATKNGALAAEAILCFDPELARTLGYRRKRGGHLFSKMRFLSAQLVAYLDNDLWMHNARHANQMAARLAEGLQGLPGMRLLHPVEANEIFVEMPAERIERLLATGFQFYRWTGPQTIRLVTAFDTAADVVEAFLEVAAQGLCVSASAEEI